jgi:plasmid stabilization system protein ParE
MSGFVLHPEAVTDLNEIQDYIASENRRAADQVLQEIFEAIQTLVSLPQLGRN